MTLKRHQKFWLELEKKWTEKWFKFITSLKDGYWGDFSKNPNLTMELIESHPEYKWNWRGVSSNPNLTMHFIEAHPEYDWDWSCVSVNPNITIISSHLSLLVSR